MRRNRLGQVGGTEHEVADHRIHERNGRQREVVPLEVAIHGEPQAGISEQHAERPVSGDHRPGEARDVAT